MDHNYRAMPSDMSEPIIVRLISTRGKSKCEKPQFESVKWSLAKIPPLGSFYLAFGIDEPNESRPGMCDEKGRGRGSPGNDTVMHQDIPFVTNLSLSIHLRIYKICHKVTVKRNIQRHRVTRVYICLVGTYMCELNRVECVLRYG